MGLRARMQTLGHFGLFDGLIDALHDRRCPRAVDDRLVGPVGTDVERDLKREFCARQVTKSTLSALDAATSISWAAWT